MPRLALGGPQPDTATVSVSVSVGGDLVYGAEDALAVAGTVGVGDLLL